MNYRCELLDKLPVLLLKQGYHRGLFENSLEDRAREQVSGLLLVYSSHVCHVVEVSYRNSRWDRVTLIHPGTNWLLSSR